MEKVQKGDFIEVEYTGKLIDGKVFDTTDSNTAKKNEIYSEKMRFGPAIICLGEQQLLPGLEVELEGKEVGKSYTLNLPPEKAFGKRDIKKIKIVPAGTFKEHKVQPYPGLQVDVDGEIGTITQVSGGRIIVNFNHPLAGREVIYEVRIIRKVTDQKEQIYSFLYNSFKIPQEKINLSLQEQKAEIELPLALPPQFLDAFGKRLAELVKLKEVVFKKKEPISP